MKLSQRHQTSPFTRLLTIALALAFCPLFAVAQGQTPAPTAKKTIPLFNGKNLDGWYVFIRGKGRDNDPKKVFSVRDGLIRISGEEYGCITTTEEYENYVLEVEYKTGTEMFAPRVGKSFDCGILVHSFGEDGAYSGVWMKSIEVQIIDGGTGDFIVVMGKPSTPDLLAITATVDPEAMKLDKPRNDYKEGGTPITIHGGRINRIGRSPEWKDVAGFRGENEIEKPHGEWNILKCVAEGDTITVYVNGKLVNRATDVRPTKGRIQVQSEGAEFFFKRLDLTPL